MKIKPSKKAKDIFLHPLVRIHPETNRKSLFINPVYTMAIDGLHDDESKLLLNELFNHMEQDTYISIKKKEAELTGKSVHIEMLDLDKDEVALSQSVKEEVNKVLNEDFKEEEVDMFDPNKEMEGIEGIDY